ncbi:hypothetical protein [Succinivibrio sp.]|uniref:hypothetical protein n=1 Tax=Succinivibrio sp. TaxID=2053619 RepID=UPI00258EBAAA|nr:hypothetical protein [Succinivibrio sp.]MDD6205262.1 hypothetical protein [Succinivibrio sp.]
MFELLFLLLPVAALYGYFMGRSTSKQKRENDKNRQDSIYLKGFDYLLSNKQDKAVDKFIAYLNSIDQTYESSLALGNLFRQQGEVDKAISLHEKMSNDSSLDESERELAKIELIRDFLSAGLLDRAEKILSDVIDIPRLRKTAVMLLLSLYEKEQDFEKAIQIANHYSDYLDKNSYVQLSNYYCEVAKKFSLNADYKQSEEYLKRALVTDSKCVRALIEMAELKIKNNEYQEAIEYVKYASSADPESGPLCLVTLKKCFQNSADPNYRFALEDLVQRTNSADVIIEYVKCVEQNSGVDDALAHIQNIISAKPNLKLLSEYLELNSKKDPVTSHESILKIKSVFDAQIARNNRYVCKNCGFESRIQFYQCPSCRKWDSLKTKTGLDGD